MLQPEEQSPDPIQTRTGQTTKRGLTWSVDVRHPPPVTWST